ncbi:hypothetical protein PACTADRAFT_2334 [Pachysolen tannophilus NRRL Y-2460]|uniref:Phosphatidate phosphatase APP1 catalytic domain-containing protein n=1 Tax=Pachysolen tannophilus NRRL Y-2460 TaxID=669874 RepID=A0A1E4TW94_PACTA|nr:hypothetical protein PACTADRAFT_2334 [Pachysolen tannophilus NRRL Y-2460]
MSDKISLGSAIYSAVKPIVKVYLIIFTGFFLAKKNFLSVEITRGLSNIVLLVLMPCLILDEIITNISDSDIKIIGIIVLNAVVMYGTGFFFALLTSFFLPVPRHWRGGYIAGNTLPNVSDLPIAYIQTLSGGVVFTTDEGDKGVSYICICLATYIFVQFNLGLFQIIEYDFKDKDDDSKIEDSVRPEGDDGSSEDGPSEEGPKSEKEVEETHSPSNHDVLINDGINNSNEENVITPTDTISINSSDEEFENDNETFQVRPFQSHRSSNATGNDFGPILNSRSRAGSKAGSKPGSAAGVDTEGRVNTRASISSTRNRSRSVSSYASTLSTNANSTNTTHDLVREYSRVQSFHSHNSDIHALTTTMSILTEQVSRKDVEESGKNISFVKKYKLQWLVFFLRNFLKPSAIALILSVTIAMIPWVKALFVSTSVSMPNAPDDEPPLSFLMDYFSYIGQAAVPIGLLLLGSTGARLKINSVPPGFWKCVLVLTSFRLCIMPIIGVLWVHRLQSAGWISDDKLAAFIMLLEWSLPSATIQIYLTATYADPSAETCIQMDCLSLYMIAQYSILFITLPFSVSKVRQATLIKLARALSKVEDAKQVFFKYTSFIRHRNLFIQKYYHLNKQKNSQLLIYRRNFLQSLLFANKNKRDSSYLFKNLLLRNSSFVSDFTPGRYSRMHPESEYDFRPESAPPQYGDNGNISGNNNQNSGNISRRSKLMGMVKSTKDTYIPTIASSITNFATQKFTISDELEGIPANSKLSLYNTYTRYNAKEKKYVTDVKGWIYCNGAMTRKNRLILSLARQMTKVTGAPPEAVEELQGQLSDKVNNPDLLSSLEPEPEPKSPYASLRKDETSPSSVSTASASSVASNSENILKERLAGFLSRSISYAKLKITIGSEKKLGLDKLISNYVNADVNGTFECSIVTDYEPSVVQAVAVENESIFSFNEVNIVPNEGISIISDVDDTVRVTGVVGDKRDLFRNVFVKEFKDCEVPKIASWYSSLAKKNCAFHYVSNSPWQLYYPIYQFIETIGLPIGSIHLKQYTGNLLSSLMQASSQRKRPAISKIVSDFSNRKFIMIGDSGEQDLETYLSIAKDHPKQVLAIYIRIVPHSLSDLDDNKVYNEILKALTNRDKDRFQNTEASSLSADASTKSEIHSDLIDLDSEIKDNHKSSINQNHSAPLTSLLEFSHPPPPPPPLPRSAPLPRQSKKYSPMIPNKPSSLRGNKTSKSEHENTFDSVEHFVNIDGSPSPTEISRQLTRTFEGYSIEETRPPLPARSTFLDSSRPTSPFSASSSHLAVSSSPTLPPRRVRDRDPLGYSQITSNSLDNSIVMPSDQDNYMTTIEYDRKAELWRERIMRVVKDLPNDVDLKFWFDVDDIKDECLKKVSEYLK